MSLCVPASATSGHQQTPGFYFDIKITDETNTKDEKALYIKEAFDGFARILGSLHEESCIYVQDVRAASYGFGGYTQEYRYHHQSVFGLPGLNEAEANWPRNKARRQ